ncbi:hypothetical protein [Endozoicomonas sp. ALC066]|uniref:hypothetical protein n=1 Tax=Endozoicomonas sp. ALC066 TaxID=3403078 RepID=UPI003BB4D8CE
MESSTKTEDAEQWCRRKMEEALQRYKETKDDRFLDDAGNYEQMLENCRSQGQGKD